MNIPERLWNEILLHLERELPCEGVGVLVVSTQEKDDADFRYIPLKNTADDETHFRVEPAEWVSLLHEIDRSGERVQAIVHSHPASPPEPSEEDRRSFYYPEVSMLIVSFQNRENPEARLYINNKDGDSNTILVSPSSFGDKPNADNDQGNRQDTKQCSGR